MPVAERRGLPAEITQESRRRGGRFARDAGQALGITRDIGDRQNEGAVLGNLANCRYSLGEYRQAIALHTQALGITRDIGDRHGEANGGTFGGVACGQHDDKPADQPCSPPRRGW
jgi:hypothetical protein